MNISLTLELERFVVSRIRSGRYGSASEVVREALRLLQDREVLRQTTMDSLRQDIAEGLQQAKAGHLLDGEGVFAGLLAKASPRRARRK